MISALQSHALRDEAIVSALDGSVLHYEQLLSWIEINREAFAAIPRPALAFLACTNSAASITAYLGCRAAHMPVCLADPESRVLLRLVASYRPSIVILPCESPAPAGYRDVQTLAGGNYRIYADLRQIPYAFPIHSSLAVLLTTSGSTGSAKLVRLSEENLTANAVSIAQYLKLEPGERSIQSLPMHYAYGLSLVNSHLQAGGTVVLTPHSCMRREFWSDFDQHACTSFAGVPYTYELLRRLRLDPATRPTLRTMTQAGGGMSADLLAHYHQAAQQYGKRLYIMYGQTEATARISYVPPERLGEKAGAIGIPIPGGTLSLAPAEDFGQAEELLYQGPNVMLGYANGPADLASGDMQQGRLRTGDLGRMDDDGYFYLLGRLQRIGKVFGKRMQLADVEREVERNFPCRAAVVDRGNKLGLYMEARDTLDPSAVRCHVARFLSLAPVFVDVELLDRIPMTASGKIDYSSLGVVDSMALVS